MTERGREGGRGTHRFSGPVGQCGNPTEGPECIEKAACIRFAPISSNPPYLNLSPPQSACQQINTIRKDQSAIPGLTVISQISERPREDKPPPPAKPRLTPQISSLRPSYDILYISITAGCFIYIFIRF